MVDTILLATVAGCSQGLVNRVSSTALGCSTQVQALGPSSTSTCVRVPSILTRVPSPQTKFQLLEPPSLNFFITEEAQLNEVQPQFLLLYLFLRKRVLGMFF